MRIGFFLRRIKHQALSHFGAILLRFRYRYVILSFFEAWFFKKTGWNRV